VVVIFARGPAGNSLWDYAVRRGWARREGRQPLQPELTTFRAALKSNRIVNGVLGIAIKSRRWSRGKNLPRQPGFRTNYSPITSPQLSSDILRTTFRKQASSRDHGQSQRPSAQGISSTNSPSPRPFIHPFLAKARARLQRLSRLGVFGEAAVDSYVSKICKSTGSKHKTTKSKLKKPRLDFYARGIQSFHRQNLPRRAECESNFVLSIGSWLFRAVSHLNGVFDFPPACWHSTLVEMRAGQDVRQEGILLVG